MSGYRRCRASILLILAVYSCIPSTTASFTEPPTWSRGLASQSLRPSNLSDNRNPTGSTGWSSGKSGSRSSHNVDNLNRLRKDDKINLLSAPCSNPLWEEQNGVIMIEAENIDFAAADNKWTLETSEKEQSFIGYDYLNIEMTSVYKLKKVGKLCYPVKFHTTGWWKFEMRSINGGKTEHNDVFALMSNYNWIVVRSQDGDVRNSTTARQDLGKAYTKAYRNGKAGTWKWDTRTVDFDPHEFFFYVDEPGASTELCVAGRSTVFGIGKLLLFNLDQISAKDARKAKETHECVTQSLTSSPSVSPSASPTASPTSSPSVSPSVAPTKPGATFSPTEDKLCAPIYPDPGMWTDAVLPDISTVMSLNNTADAGVVELIIHPNSDSMQRSTIRDNSFVLKNKASENIQAILIDVTDCVMSDSVFDPDGTAGDAGFLALKFKGSDQTYGGESVFKFFQDPPFNGDPVIQEVAGSTGGYKGLYYEFPTPLAKGQVMRFGVEMDGNSIAKVADDKWKLGAYLDDAQKTWNLGGISGSELIGSRFYVKFQNGATAMGHIGSDGYKAGGKAKAKYRSSEKSVIIKFVTDTGIIRSDEKRIGQYGGVVPALQIEGQQGAQVRISILKGFNPVLNDAKYPNNTLGVRGLIEERLHRGSPQFPVNNFYDVQSRDYILGDNGKVCIQDFDENFNFSPAPDYSYNTHIALVANVLAGGYPDGPVARIFLFPTGVNVSDACGSVLCPG
uniref:Uncharacterized protein n=1 Tax=Lotharella globosa TaxID=91324 RepID=A0A7S4DVS9_9EUKA